MGARIVAVADVFDVLIHERPYNSCSPAAITNVLHRNTYRTRNFSTAAMSSVAPSPGTVGTV
jgi:response regulator RpfG family c-di-GMP phosphodiesterase